MLQTIKQNLQRGIHDFWEWEKQGLKKGVEHAKLRSQGKKCPKCDQYAVKEIKTGVVKEGLAQIGTFAVLGFFALLRPKPKTTFLCKNCGFSWTS